MPTQTETAIIATLQHIAYSFAFQFGSSSFHLPVLPPLGSYPACFRNTLAFFPFTLFAPFAPALVDAGAIQGEYGVVTWVMSAQGIPY